MRPRRGTAGPTAPTDPPQAGVPTPQLHRWRPPGSRWPQYAQDWARPEAGDDLCPRATQAGGARGSTIWMDTHGRAPGPGSGGSRNVLPAPAEVSHAQRCDSYRLLPTPTDSSRPKPPNRPPRAPDHRCHRSRMRHHHQRPAVHSLTGPGFGRVRRSNSTSIRSTRRPRSARAPLGRRRRAISRSSRPSSISMPGLSPGPVRYRPGCLKAHSDRLRASATAFGHRYSSSTRRTAARVRADTPGIRRTGTCLQGCHRSARTAFGRLRGIVLSEQNHVGILPRRASPQAGSTDSVTFLS